MKSLALELGGEQKARDMIKGKGISLILGELSIKYRRPVVYPDTVSVFINNLHTTPTHSHTHVSPCILTFDNSKS